MAGEGALLEAARAADAEAVFGAHPDRRSRPRRGGTVWVSADGTMVHDRATGTEGPLELLAAWAYEAAAADPARSARPAAVWGYVADNRRAIESYAIVPLASSGPIEKAVDLVIARRFNARGMSWFRRGVSALVRLRLLRLNGTWASYWSERFTVLLRPWPSAA